MTTTTDLINEVRSIAETYPDFEYNYQVPNHRIYNCSYFPDTVKGHPVRPCIIGQALINLRVPTRDLYELEATQDDTGISEQILTETLRIDIDSPEDVDWLRTAQKRQDYGDTWSTAVNEADRKINEPAKAHYPRF